MKISLINIDSKITNLALAKIAKYHTDKGDEVIWDMPIIPADKTYVSCVFTKNRRLAEQWEGKAAIGGSGYSLDVKLPKEIESVKPRINYGFTTRGCIRNCGFCIVPQKEGKIRIVGDLLDLWDGKSRDVVVMDNNILALPEHFEKICNQAIENNIRIDFNQGLDCRLLTDKIVELLTKISHKEYHFAFDNPSSFHNVERAIWLLRRNGIKRSCWYVLCGFGTTFEQDLERCEYLKSEGQNVFVQRYETVYRRPEYIALARWANQHHIFQGMTLKQFMGEEIRRSKGVEDYIGCVARV